MKDSLMYIAIGIMLVIAASLFWMFTNTQTITINGDEARVYIANNSLERWLGLSWRGEDLATDGMLFTYRTVKERTFWMRGMQFNLDVIFIKDGKVISIDKNVPAPADGEEPKRMYSGPMGADAVLEMPAGGIDEYGIVVGQKIEL